MAKDFIGEINKSYAIPYQIAIMAGPKPTDMRQVCDTVEDFQTFKSQTGMELRYGGLVTYEESTKKFKGCIKNSDNTFSWVDLNMEHADEISKMNNQLDELQERISSVMLEFEENVKMMQLDIS